MWLVLRHPLKSSKVKEKSIGDKSFEMIVSKPQQQLVLVLLKCFFVKVNKISFHLAPLDFLGKLFADVFCVLDDVFVAIVPPFCVGDELHAEEPL